VQVISPYRANGIPPLEVVVADLPNTMMLSVVIVIIVTESAKILQGKVPAKHMKSTMTKYYLMGMKPVTKFGNQMRIEPVDFNIFRKVEAEIILKTLDFGKKIGDENGARNSLRGLWLPIIIS